MRFRLLFALIFLSFVVSACNLGSSSNNGDEDELPTADLNDTSAPVVQIISPANGSTGVVNEQILVSVLATHPSGVTRIQLFADGQPVKTISSESITGDPQFEGILDFTPRAEGEYTLRVLAFRNTISSEPVDITVTVGDEDIQVTQRPGNTTGSSTGSTTGSGDGGVIIPEIPNDGLCRVLVNVGLNLRTEPTTVRQNVITTLQSGTLLLVMARLGDNSWWKVNYNNRIGWVSGNAQYTTLYGNCGSVPVENFVVNTPTPTNRPPVIPTATFTQRPTSTPGLPDLLVPSLVSTVDNIVIPSGQSQVVVEFGITIKNQGSGPSGQFAVTLREGTTTYDVAVVGNLLAGEIITLTQDVSFTVAGEHDIRVDVDSNNQVTEMIEVNNRADITVNVSNE